MKRDTSFEGRVTIGVLGAVGVVFFAYILFSDTDDFQRYRCNHCHEKTNRYSMRLPRHCSESPSYIRHPHKKFRHGNAYGVTHFIIKNHYETIEVYELPSKII